MSEFFHTAVYFKNVPTIERIVRVGLALGLAALPVLWPSTGWATGALWLSAASAAATGFIGFCPACYLAGRNLVSRRP